MAHRRSHLSEAYEIVRTEHEQIKSACLHLSVLACRPHTMSDALRLAYRVACRGGFSEIESIIVTEYRYQVLRAMARGYWSGHAIGL